jgi:hypothetical protein
MNTHPSEWWETTLVAITYQGNNKWVITELPAKQITCVSRRRKFYRSELAAEQALEEQYDPQQVLKVSADDLSHEVLLREPTRLRILQERLHECTAEYSTAITESVSFDPETSSPQTRSRALQTLGSLQLEMAYIQQDIHELCRIIGERDQ